MGRRVYIETSVVSYLTARPSRQIVAAAWQQVTREWWNHHRTRFEIFTSELVFSEASKGDSEAVRKRIEILDGIPELEVTSDVVTLAKALVVRGALPADAMDDAMHVAVSAFHGIDYLVTWNCRHLDNAEMKPLIRSVCAIAGYPCPEICTPQELMGAQDHD